MESGGFLGRLLGPLLEAVLPLIKIVVPLRLPLGLTAEVSAAEEGMHKNILGSRTTTLIISSDEMQNIMKIVEESLEDFGLLLKGASETIQNEAKEQKRGFLIILLGILRASFLRNILARKVITQEQDMVLREEKLL